MDRTFYELREALSQPGCPVCKLERETERRYLDTLFYELVNDYRTRAQLLEAGGFCPTHTATIFEERNSVLGIAIIYRDLLAHFSEQNTSPRCPLCELLKEKERHCFFIIRKQWVELKSHWGERTFFCKRHLGGIERDEKCFSEIADLTRKSLNTIQEDLSRFIEKFDYRKAHLPLRKEEEISWQEALEFFAGKVLKKGRHDL